MNDHMITKSEMIGHSTQCSGRTVQVGLV